MLKVHLDTDIGSDIDDLCALFMLLNLPQVEITGITTVGEYKGIRAGLVQRVLDLSHREIPVAAGADITCYPYRITPWFLPFEKYWPGRITENPGSVDKALTLLKHSVEQGAVLIGIGPYTNFALLEDKYPGILAASKIVLTGGYLPFHHDPLEPLPWFVPEHNFQSDPDSSRVVMEKGKPLFVPLSTTTKTALRKCHLADLAQASPVGELISHQANAFLHQFGFDRSYGGKEGLPKDLINFLHDPLTCAVATGWDEVEREEYGFSLDSCDGHLISRLDPKGRACSFVTQVQARAFDDYWIETCCKPSRESAEYRKLPLQTLNLQSPAVALGQ